MRIMANDRSDVDAMVEGFRHIHPANRWKFVAAVHQLGLMQGRGLLRLVIGIVKWCHGTTGVNLLMRRLWDKSPSTINGFFEQTLEHFQHGHDREDRDSIGGLSQREWDLLLKTLNMAED